MRYLRPDGKEMSQAEFEAIFGPNVTVESVSGAKWAVYALQDSGDNQAQVVELLAMDTPTGVNGRLSWPGDSYVSYEWKSEPFLPHPFCPLVVGQNYFPDRINEPGPYSVDLAGAPSEKVHGLGLVAGTNHRHVRVWYQKAGTAPPPPPPWKDQAYALLDEMDALLETLQGKFDALRALVDAH